MDTMADCSKIVLYKEKEMMLEGARGKFRLFHSGSQCQGSNRRGLRNGEEEDLVATSALQPPARLSRAALVPPSDRPPLAEPLQEPFRESGGVSDVGLTCREECQPQSWAGL